MLIPAAASGESLRGAAAEIETAATWLRSAVLEAKQCKTLRCDSPRDVRVGAAWIPPRLHLFRKCARFGGAMNGRIIVPDADGL